jgi:hypothetical protein
VVRKINIPLLLSLIKVRYAQTRWCSPKLLKSEHSEPERSELSEKERGSHPLDAQTRFFAIGKFGADAPQLTTFAFVLVNEQRELSVANPKGENERSESERSERHSSAE